MKRAIKNLLILCVLLACSVLQSKSQTVNTGSGTKAHVAGIVLQEFLYTTASFPQCHSATILELENKELLCSFFGGTYERHPDVEIRLSRKKPGGQWTTPVSVANGIQTDTSRLPTWNPVLFQPKGRPLMLFYKVGPSPSEWWGELKTSNDGGITWSMAKRLPGNLLGPVKNKPIQLRDGTILSGSSNEKNGWKCHVERSENGGQTWTMIGPVNDPKKVKAIQPTLLTYPGGDIQMLSRTSYDEDGYIAENWSKDGGLTWSEMKATSLPNNNSGIDAVTLKDGRQLLVYNHSTRTQKGMGHKGRGVLNVAVSKDGQHWDAALVLDYIDQPEMQYSYPAVIQTSDGLVHIVYTWHRTRIKHVVIDPNKLETYPIENGKWPYAKIPLVKSTEQ
ncbi:MAG: sialidase family protein [Bacteroidota bacterium]